MMFPDDEIVHGNKTTLLDNFHSFSDLLINKVFPQTFTKIKDDDIALRTFISYNNCNDYSQ